jgi:hypothetical protein
VGFVVDEVALRQVFSEYFGFPCHFHSTDCSTHHHHHQHLSSGAGTTGQIVANVPSGLSLTPSQKTKKEKIHYTYTHSNINCGAGQIKNEITSIYASYTDITSNPAKQGTAISTHLRNINITHVMTLSE